MIRGNLKHVKNQPIETALEVITYFNQFGFEVIVDNGELIVLKEVN